ncbi:glycosyltransferase family 8 protein [Ruegeria sp.]|uniref:glycosyltransferase family 8 protein n=1 Tax=Ruegeria sp. TaxID=1879320 RepID=UPI003C7AB7DD
MPYQDEGNAPEYPAGKKYIQMVNTSQQLGFSASGPARNRKAIMFCCDQNYLVFAAHAASQIADLHPQRDFDICICFDKRPVSVPDTLDHLNIRLCHVKTGDLFKGLRLDRGKSHDVYLRLALPLAFADDYDRILYLDSDIFIQGGDFSSLMDVDFAPHPIAAVRDNTQWRTPKRRPKQFKTLNLPAAPYFNAGVILMDVTRYNEQNLLDRCLTLGKEHADIMIRHDQNLYNSVLQGDWAELSPMWNWQFTWSSLLFAMQIEPHLVHFIGKTKPWKDPKGELSPRFAKAMQAFSERYFPDLDVLQAAGQPLAPDSAKMRKMLLKHFVSGARTQRYLNRFSDDLQVITSRSR